MTEPPESLADPGQERLTNPDEALRRHYLWRSGQMDVGRPTAAAVALVAAGIGLVTILLVIAWWLA